MASAKILGVVGSLKKSSLTHEAVRHVLERLKIHGAEVKLIDLHETPLPLLNPDDPSSAAFHQILPQVLWANGFVLGTPDYHGGMSGTMKNFLDHFWKEFAGKIFGYVCASHEKGLTAMDQMRTAVRQCYGWSLPYGVCVTDGDFDMHTRRINHPNVEKRLQMMAYDLAIYTPLIRTRYEADLAGDNPDAGFAMHYRSKKT